MHVFARVLCIVYVLYTACVYPMLEAQCLSLPPQRSSDSGGEQMDEESLEAEVSLMANVLVGDAVLA